MRNRALQLVVLAVLGIGLGFWLNRAEDAGADPAPVSENTAASVAPAANPAPAASHDIPPPPAREYKLPSMAAMTSDVTASAPQLRDVTEKPPLPVVMVPSDWLLRGSAPEKYDLLSDRVQAHGGAASALLRSHDKDIASTRFGSLMQNVIAEPFLGKRMEFSAFLRAENVRERTVALWFRAVDTNNIVLVSENTAARAPKVTDAWTRYSIVVDVPWSAAELGYGITLAGKGAVWVDDVSLDAVDPEALPLTGTLASREAGVAVQVPSQGGPLRRPANFGFEEVGPAARSLRESLPDAINATRY